MRLLRLFIDSIIETERERETFRVCLLYIISAAAQNEPGYIDAVRHNSPLLKFVILCAKFPLGTIWRVYMLCLKRLMQFDRLLRLMNRNLKLGMCKGSHDPTRLLCITLLNPRQAVAAALSFLIVFFFDLNSIVFIFSNDILLQFF